MISGMWQYTRAYVAPDRYGWRIVTEDEPICHLFDRATALSFVGDEEVARDPSSQRPPRTDAHSTAVVNLDAVATGGVVVAPLAAGVLPDGVRQGLSVIFPDGSEYRIGFDDRMQLVWACGPPELSPVAKGDAMALFTDHRARSNAS